jgi:hypothetical protein
MALAAERCAFSISVKSGEAASIEPITRKGVI